MGYGLNSAGDPLYCLVNIDTQEVLGFPPTMSEAITKAKEAAEKKLGMTIVIFEARKQFAASVEVHYNEEDFPQ